MNVSVFMSFYIMNENVKLQSNIQIHGLQQSLLFKVTVTKWGTMVLSGNKLHFVWWSSTNVNVKVGPNSNNVLLSDII